MRETEKLLADILFRIDAVRGDRGSGYKGLAQRYHQLTKPFMTGRTREVHEDEFVKNQKNLRKRIQDYIDEGGGDPPPRVLEWANKEVPKLPVQVPDDSPEVPNDNQMVTGLETLILYMLQNLRVPL